MLNYKLTQRQIIKEYLMLNGDTTKSNGLSLKDCLTVFDYFYRKYKATFGEDHPRLTSASIYSILADIDFITLESNDGFRSEPMDVESYIGIDDSHYGLIDIYFEQEFYKCNYSIAHFMSGRIREICYYQSMIYEF